MKKKFIKKLKLQKKVALKVFEALIKTVERNAVDNTLTIPNVSLFVKLWRDELKTELEVLSIKKEIPYPRVILEDGSLTDAALAYLKNWHYDSGNLDDFTFDSLIDYLKIIWAYPDSIVYENGILELHTVGWSDNEAIIIELKRTFFWIQCYVAHRAGGHYYFKVSGEKEIVINVGD